MAPVLDPHIKLQASSGSGYSSFDDRQWQCAVCLGPLWYYVMRLVKDISLQSNLCVSHLPTTYAYIILSSNHVQRLSTLTRDEKLRVSNRGSEIEQALRSRLYTVTTQR